MLIGKMAPFFNGQAIINGQIQDITLGQFKGKWLVLFFYPGDFTFVWPTELAEIAVRYNDFEKLNVQIITISVDSVYSHKIWDEIELSKLTGKGFPYPMLSDQGGDISKLYDVYDEQAKTSIRATYIIDPQGTIQTAELIGPGVGRNTEELIRLIKANQVYASTNQGVPADWKEGDKVLDTSVEMAGEIHRVWKP